MNERATTPHGLLRPARIYFDTANLEDLARLPLAHEDRQSFHRRILEGTFVPALSFTHCIEIAKKGDELRARIVGLLEVPVDQGRVVWVRSARTLQDLEWRMAARRGGDGTLASEDVFRHRFDKILERGPVPPGGWKTRMSFAEQIKALRPCIDEWYLAHSSRWSESLEQLRERRRAGALRVPKYDRTHRACIAVTGIPESLESGGKEIVVDVDWMPAHRITINYEEGTVRSSVQVLPTDAEDRWHLPGVAYADVAFVDGRVHERLRVAGGALAHIHPNREWSRVFACIGPVTTARSF